MPKQQSGRRAQRLKRWEENITPNESKGPEARNEVSTAEQVKSSNQGQRREKNENVDVKKSAEQKERRDQQGVGENGCRAFVAGSDDPCDSRGHRTHTSPTSLSVVSPSAGSQPLRKYLQQGNQQTLQIRASFYFFSKLIVSPIPEHHWVCLRLSVDMKHQNLWVVFFGKQVHSAQAEQACSNSHEGREMSERMDEWTPECIKEFSWRGS